MSFSLTDRGFNFYLRKYFGERWRACRAAIGVFGIVTKERLLKIGQSFRSTEQEANSGLEANTPNAQPLMVVTRQIKLLKSIKSFPALPSETSGLVKISHYCNKSQDGDYTKSLY